VPCLAGGIVRAGANLAVGERLVYEGNGARKPVASGLLGWVQRLVIRTRRKLQAR